MFVRQCDWPARDRSRPLEAATGLERPFFSFDVDFGSAFDSEPNEGTLTLVTKLVTNVSGFQSLTSDRNKYRSSSWRGGAARENIHIIPVVYRITYLLF